MNASGRPVWAVWHCSKRRVWGYLRARRSRSSRPARIDGDADVTVRASKSAVPELARLLILRNLAQIRGGRKPARLTPSGSADHNARNPVDMDAVAGSFGRSRAMA